MKDGIYLIEMGAKIKAIRILRGITLRDLGKMCNIDFGSISRIENGKMNCHILSLKKLSDVLEVDVKDFL